MKDLEMAYAAGLFEGEGTVFATTGYYINRKGVKCKRKTPYLNARIAMTDLEPLQRFNACFYDLGTFNGPYQKGRDKPIYVLQFSGKAKVTTLYLGMQAWLSPRRLKQFEDALNGGECHSI